MEDILQSFRLTAEEQESYTAVRNKFGAFFVKRETYFSNSVSSPEDAKKRENP